jgi:hypothetical protein
MWTACLPFSSVHISFGVCYTFIKLAHSLAMGGLDAFLSPALICRLGKSSRGVADLSLSLFLSFK